MVAEKADQSEAPKVEKTETPKAEKPAVEEKKKEPVVEEKPAETAKDDTFKKPAPAKKQSNLEEQKPEVTTSTNDDTEQSKPSEDATLILSAEEEAEISAQTNEDAVKESASKTASDPKSAKKKKEAQKNVWISNISRGTKAADLKKLFSENFKVESAKIVTNGKSFFGYICLETTEMAQKSVKDLDGSTLSGRKIAVSLTRPDIRTSRSSASDTRRRDSRKDPKITNGVKKSDAAEGDKEKKGEKDGEKKEENGAETDKDAKDSTTDEKKSDDPEEEKERLLRRRELRTKRLIDDLKTDLKRVTTELSNNRRRLTEANRRLDGERDRKVAMRREIETLEGQLKSERRKFQQELEQMDRKRKMDETRYQDDRAVLNKELDECRKLREYLQRKIDDLGLSRQTRSPPRARGGPGRGVPEEKMGRSRMHSSENRGGRSPPPAPKINSRRSRERSPGPYKSKKPRLEDPSGRPYGNSHYSSQPSFSNAKPLMGHYPQGGSSGGPPREAMYGSTAYPEPHRYGGSGGYPSGGYPMGNPAPLMSRPMGYPDVRGSSGGQRKY